MENRTLERVGNLAIQGDADGGNETPLGLNTGVAGVHEHETARAVGVLRASGPEAAVTEQRGLLVARNAGDRGAVRHNLIGNAAVIVGTPLDLRQHRTRNVEQLEQLVVPLERMDVEQHRAARVGVVGGVYHAARQVVDEPSVDGSEHELAGIGRRAGAVHVVEDPFDLGSREIRIGHEAGLVADDVGHAVRDEGIRDLGRAAALPHNGVVHGQTGIAVPHHGGLALVGDADGGDAVGMDAALELNLHHDRDLGGQDLHGILLDPARTRIEGFNTA